MATEPSPQRVYRAACPNCGAPVEFRSAASAFAICSFCRSTVVREGDALRKIGQSAELFDDHSPLQLGASGTLQGAPFVLVGRLQYRYAEGTWNEWHALFDSADGSQRSGWLSEDNGRYVFAFDAPLGGPAPPVERLQVGAQGTIAGQSWSVASVNSVALIAAQGELPYKPNLTQSFYVSDLRSERGEVGTLDYSDPAAVRWSIGRSVAISELAMHGLADAAEKTLKGRSIECPNCGASLEVKLSTTQSIVCHQCHSVVDLTSKEGQGVGTDLQFYAQQNGTEPQIPLGTVGTLAFGGTQALPWQVVGYVERCEVPEAGDDERSFWREYLLYHRTEGFAFIVDAQDGWSWSAPITGVPERAGDGVKLNGVMYRKLYDYTGMVTYVLGEFYWRLTLEQRTFNSDYQGTGSAGAKRLNREMTATGREQEVVWSAGETLPVEVVMNAFRLAPAQAAAMQRDALPTAFKASSLLAKVLFWLFIAIIVFLIFRCSTGGSSSNCNAIRNSYGDASTEYQNCLNSSGGGVGGMGGFRTSGGSFGGFSSGGSHK